MNFSEVVTRFERTNSTSDVNVSAPPSIGFGVCNTCAVALPIYTIGVKLCTKFIVPFILICGVIGNILTLVVLRGKLFRSSPSSAALGALALADIGVLCSVGVNHWLSISLRIHLNNMSWWSCKLFSYAITTTQQLSTSFLVLTTLERVIGVWFPLKIKVWVTRKRMVRVCLILALVVLIAYFPVILDMFINENLYGMCTWGDNPTTRTIFWWIELSLTGFIHLPIIIIGNFLIILQLRYSAKKRNEEMVHTGNKLDKSIVVMLVSIGVIFLLTVVPRKLFYVGLEYGIWYDFQALVDHRYFALIKFVNNILDVLQYLSSAINFAAYCLSGSRFRAAFKALF